MGHEQKKWVENSEYTMMKKQKYIDALREGDRIDDIFLVRSSRLGETRAGKPYLILELTDKSGDIGGPVWDNAERFVETCRAGNFIKVRCQVQSYREKLQLRIEEIVPVAKENVDLSDFVPASDHDIGEMASEIKAIIASLDKGYIRSLIEGILGQEEIWKAFLHAPAAKGIHHAYAGGLLEHCLSMAKLADFLSSHYVGIDRALLLAGALLHDIGKLKELEEDVGLVDYTVAGRLKGHIVIGCELVAREAERIDGFPEELLVQLQHLLLSHHGKLEFGSPVLPMTPEAFLLSYIDDMDSKMNLFEQLRKKQKQGETGFSDYQRSLERYLYVTPVLSENMEKPPVHEVRQGTLF